MSPARCDRLRRYAGLVGFFQRLCPSACNDERIFSRRISRQRLHHRNTVDLELYAVDIGSQHLDGNRLMASPELVQLLDRRQRSFSDRKVPVFVLQCEELPVAKRYDSPVRRTGAAGRTIPRGIVGVSQEGEVRYGARKE
jgi:hypothetical protein